MSLITLILIAIGLGLAGWLAGRAKAWSFQSADPETRPVARPVYHAWYVAVWVVVPVLLFVLVWSFVAPGLVLQSVLASPAAENLPAFGFEREAWLNEARAVASGNAEGVFNAGAEALDCKPAERSALTEKAIMQLRFVARGADEFLKGTH